VEQSPRSIIESTLWKPLGMCANSNFDFIYHFFVDVDFFSFGM